MPMLLSSRRNWYFTENPLFSSKIAIFEKFFAIFWEIFMIVNEELKVSFVDSSVCLGDVVRLAL